MGGWGRCSVLVWTLSECGRELSRVGAAGERVLTLCVSPFRGREPVHRTGDAPASPGPPQGTLQQETPFADPQGQGEWWFGLGEGERPCVIISSSFFESKRERNVFCGRCVLNGKVGCMAQAGGVRVNGGGAGSVDRYKSVLEGAVRT